eukprot:6214847-Pleurochrysis_carterae.AAC.7
MHSSEKLKCACDPRWFVHLQRPGTIMKSEVRSGRGDVRRTCLRIERYSYGFMKRASFWPQQVAKTNAYRLRIHMDDIIDTNHNVRTAS